MSAMTRALPPKASKCACPRHAFQDRPCDLPGIWYQINALSSGMLKVQELQSCIGRRLRCPTGHSDVNAAAIDVCICKLSLACAAIQHHKTLGWCTWRKGLRCRITLHFCPGCCKWCTHTILPVMMAPPLRNGYNLIAQLCGHCQHLPAL